MSANRYMCTSSAPPVDFDTHRRIRLRRLGLDGATARLISELAFGPGRDTIVVVANAGTLTGEARR